MVPIHSFPQLSSLIVPSLLLASWLDGMEVYCIPSFSLIVSLPCLFTYSCLLLHAFVVHDMSGLCWHALVGAYAVVLVLICTYVFLIFVRSIVAA